jgi:prevent-host-death family protein
MSKYSVAETKNHLSALIDRAVKGEEVVITRHGQPVIEFTPIAKPLRKPTQADIAWLVAHRVPRKKVSKDAGTLVSEMRDEDWK